MLTLISWWFLKALPKALPLPTGVVEYLSNGIVADNHKDFKELRYNECLMNFSGNGKNGASEGRITHGFQLKSAYENNLMPYTNYTFDFKVSPRLWQAAGSAGAILTRVEQGRTRALPSPLSPSLPAGCD